MEAPSLIGLLIASMSGKFSRPGFVILRLELPLKCEEEQGAPKGVVENGFMHAKTQV